MKRIKSGRQKGHDLKKARFGRLILEGNNSNEWFKDNKDFLNILLVEKNDKCLFSDTYNDAFYWFVEIENYGLKKISTHKCIISNESDFTMPLLQNTKKCNFKIYNYGKSLAIENYYADNSKECECYIITPISKYTYNKYMKAGGKFEI